MRSLSSRRARASPTCFNAGADAVQTFEAKANTLLAQADAQRSLSSSLSFDNA
jgi:hypothetical protein